MPPTITTTPIQPTAPQPLSLPQAKKLGSSQPRAATASLKRAHPPPTSSSSSSHHRSIASLNTLNAPMSSQSKKPRMHQAPPAAPTPERAAIPPQEWNPQTHSMPLDLNGSDGLAAVDGANPDTIRSIHDLALDARDEGEETGYFHASAHDGQSDTSEMGVSFETQTSFHRDAPEFDSSELHESDLEKGEMDYESVDGEGTFIGEDGGAIFDTDDGRSLDGSIGSTSSEGSAVSSRAESVHGTESEDEDDSMDMLGALASQNSLGFEFVQQSLFTNHGPSHELTDGKDGSLNGENEYEEAEDIHIDGVYGTNGAKSGGTSNEFHQEDSDILENKEVAEVDERVEMKEDREQSETPENQCEDVVEPLLRVGNQLYFKSFDGAFELTDEYMSARASRRVPVDDMAAKIQGYGVKIAEKLALVNEELQRFRMYKDEMIVILDNAKSRSHDSLQAVNAQRAVAQQNAKNMVVANAGVYSGVV
ncbi:hypothetical protein BC830DRAFT_1121853 [Chytriomyces sp. MP71]|nr:hypothetical protein BC830DRAFT_1121853 [Chytriomyces sp. MP71]